MENYQTIVNSKRKVHLLSLEAQISIAKYTSTFACFMFFITLHEYTIHNTHLNILQNENYFQLHLQKISY